MFLRLSSILRCCFDILDRLLTELKHYNIENDSLDCLAIFLISAFHLYCIESAFFIHDDLIYYLNDRVF